MIDLTNPDAVAFARQDANEAYARAKSAGVTLTLIALLHAVKDEVERAATIVLERSDQGEHLTFEAIVDAEGTLLFDRDVADALAEFDLYDRLDDYACDLPTEGWTNLWTAYVREEPSMAGWRWYIDLDRLDTIIENAQRADYLQGVA